MQFPEEEMVKVYDEQGRELLIRRSDWYRNTEANLRKYWDDAEKLYQLCLSSAHRKEFEPIESGTIRLLELKPGDEEVVALRASTLAGTGRTKEVELFVLEMERRYGPTTYTRFHRAMAQKARGESDQCEALLRDAIELDPNNVGAMQHWIFVREARVGTSQILRELADFSKGNDRWLAAHILGARKLQDGDIDGGIQIFREALGKEGWYPQLLREVTGELLKRDLHRAVIELIGPHYKRQPEFFDIGLWLVESWIALKELDRAEELLHSLALRPVPAYQGRIAELGSKITKLRNPVTTFTVSEKLVPTPFWVTRPTWWRALKSPDWLIPAVERKVKVAVAALTLANEVSRENASLRDALGRLSRSLPALICERLRFETDSDPTLVLIMLQSQGPCVFPGIEPAALTKMIPSNADYLVQGGISSDGTDLRLSMEIFQMPKLKSLAALRATFVAGEEGPPLASICDRIVAELQHIASLHQVESLTYQAPGPELISTYLRSVEPQAALFYKDCGFGGPETIFGRREILSHLHWLAVNSKYPQAPLIFLSALTSDKAQGAEFYKEFRRYAIGLFEKALPGGAVDRLSPLVYQLYDMPEEHERAVGRLATVGDKAYREWLVKASSEWQPPLFG